MFPSQATRTLFRDALEQMVIVLFYFALAVCLAVVEHYCAAIWKLSPWLCFGFRAISVFLFIVDAIVLCAVAIITARRGLAHFATRPVTLHERLQPGQQTAQQPQAVQRATP